MAEVKRILIELDINTGNVVGGTEAVNQQLKKLGSTATITEGQINKAAAAMQKNLAGSAGIAGAAATELGRTISDLPFGLTAVTNNISQLGNMFALLVTSAGSVKDALTAMRTALMGPVGILVAFQVVVAAIEMFAQSQRKAKKEIFDFNTSLDAQVEGLEEVARAFSDSNAEEAKRLDLLERSKTLGGEVLEGYKQEMLTRQEIVKLANLEAQAARAKEEVEKNNEKRTEDRKKLEEDLSDIRKREDRLEARRSNLRRQGFEEDQIARETANQANEIAKDRLSIETQINNIIEQQRLEEEGIYRALEEANKIRELAEQRLSAQNELTETRFELESKILQLEKERLDESGVQVVEQQRKNQQEIYQLALDRLDAEKERELQNITDPKTISVIKEKYDLLAQSAALDFKAAIENIKFEPVPIEIQPAITGKDLIEGKQTDAQKWAAKQVEKVGKVIEDELEKRVESTGERDPFVDFFGFSQKNFEESAQKVQQGLNAAFDLINSQYDKELAIEERKTIALNDQLRARLRNEQLTADARDKINQQIANNEAKLVEKQNEIEEKRFKLNKAQGIANAVINTAVAVTKVFPNIPMMAFIGALGAAQIATIANQQFVPKAMPSPNLTGQGSIEGVGAPQMQSVGSSGINQLLESINAQLEKPIRTYVIAGDVTTAQSLDRNIIREAAI